MSGGTNMGRTIRNKQPLDPSAFCWNPSCADYGKVDQGNIRRFGRTQAGTQRYQCRTCNGTFVETIGTVFYGRQHTQETIIECLALLAERNSLAAIDRVKGVKEETSWLARRGRPACGAD
jgi:transposase-like protein